MGFKLYFPTNSQIGESSWEVHLTTSCLKWLQNIGLVLLFNSLLLPLSGFHNLQPTLVVFLPCSPSWLYQLKIHGDQNMTFQREKYSRRGCCCMLKFTMGKYCSCFFTSLWQLKTGGETCVDTWEGMSQRGRKGRDSVRDELIILSRKMWQKKTSSVMQFGDMYIGSWLKHYLIHCWVDHTKSCMCVTSLHSISTFLQLLQPEHVIHLLST